MAEFKKKFNLNEVELKILWNAVCKKYKAQNNKAKIIKTIHLFQFIKQRLEAENILILIKKSVKLYKLRNNIDIDIRMA